MLLFIPFILLVASLSNPFPGVREQLKPGRILPPRILLLPRGPACHIGHDGPLRMRHHSHHPAILALHAGDAGWAAVGVGGILLRHGSVGVDVPHRDHCRGIEGLDVARRRELRPTLSVGDNDGEGGAVHVAEEHRVGIRVLDGHERVTPFELLARVLD